MQPKNAIRIALFGLGFFSIGTQIYLMREFLTVFYGNELILGVLLAVWILFTGAGSYLVRVYNPLAIRKGIILVYMMVLSGLPAFMLVGLDQFKALIVPYGSMVGLWEIICIGGLIQLPFCLINGFLFSALSLLLSLSVEAGSRFSEVLTADSSPMKSNDQLGTAYSFESLGSMVAGVLVNFIFLWFFSTYQSMTMLTAGFLLLVMIYAYLMTSRVYFLFVILFSTAFTGFLLIFDFQGFSDKMRFPNQHILANQGTPYGQVVITENEKQLNFFENGLLLFSSGNEISNEENVHYAMVQHSHPQNILLISGGFSGTLTEILKYKPVVVDYVELNPALIGIASRYTRQLEHSSIRVHETDARRFLDNTANSYDVVLVNLPAPSTLQLNRYYSLEFLKEVRKKMRSGAVIAYSLPTSWEYVSEQAGKLNAVLWNTLKNCFKNVLILPGGRNYFLASDSLLSLDIPGLIQKRGIQTAYVNQYYIDAAQLKERSAYVSDLITPSGSVNRAFTPVVVWYQMSWWLSYFKTSHGVILFIFIAILIILLITLNPLSAGLFAGGFTLVSLELILIFSLQILCGYLFQAIGAIIMIFMLGLATGSGIRLKKQQHCTVLLYSWLQVSLAISAILIPVAILSLNRYMPVGWLINFVFAVLAFSAAFIVGMEYRLAALLSKKTLQKTVAGNYSAEMFGSAAGAFAVTLFLIPSIGIFYTGIFLAALNLATALSLFLMRRKV